MILEVCRSEVWAPRGIGCPGAWSPAQTWASICLIWRSRVEPGARCRAGCSHVVRVCRQAWRVQGGWARADLRGALGIVSTRCRCPAREALTPQTTDWPRDSAQPQCPRTSASSPGPPPPELSTAGPGDPWLPPERSALPTRSPWTKSPQSAPTRWTSPWLVSFFWRVSTKTLGRGWEIDRYWL